KAVLHVDVAGEGQWTLDLSGEQPSARRGLHGDPTRTIRLSPDQLLKALRGQLDPGRFERFRDFPMFPLDREEVFAPIEKVSQLLMLGLGGTVVKIDHMQNNPALDGKWWSYIEFNPLLGLENRGLDVPIPERGLGWYGDLASVLTGGWYVVDRVRLLVNNLRTTI